MWLACASRCVQGDSRKSAQWGIHPILHFSEFVPTVRWPVTVCQSISVEPWSVGLQLIFRHRVTSASLETPPDVCCQLEASRQTFWGSSTACVLNFLWVILLLVEIKELLSYFHDGQHWTAVCWQTGVHHTILSCFQLGMVDCLKMLAHREPSPDVLSRHCQEVEPSTGDDGLAFYCPCPCEQLDVSDKHTELHKWAFIW